MSSNRLVEVFLIWYNYDHIASLYMYISPYYALQLYIASGSWMNMAADAQSLHGNGMLISAWQLNCTKQVTVNMLPHCIATV